MWGRWGAGQKWTADPQAGYSRLMDYEQLLISQTLTRETELRDKTNWKLSFVPDCRFVTGFAWPSPMVSNCLCVKFDTIGFSPTSIAPRASR